MWIQQILDTYLRAGECELAAPIIEQLACGSVWHRRGRARTAQPPVFHK